MSEHQGIVSPAYVVQRPREGTGSPYLHYLLRTPAFAKENAVSVPRSGSVHRHVWVNLGSLRVLYCGLPGGASSMAVCTLAQC